MTCRNICVFSSGGWTCYRERNTEERLFLCFVWNGVTPIEADQNKEICCFGLISLFCWVLSMIESALRLAPTNTRAASCLSGMRSMRGQSIWLNEVCKNKSSHDVSLISCAHQEGWRKWLFHQLTLTDRLWCCCHNVAVPIKIKIPINLTFEMCNPPWKGHPSCSFLEQGKGC